MRKALLTALSIALATPGGGLHAHSRVNTSTPADGAVIATLPETLTLTFGDAIRLTRVTLRHGGTETDLDLGTQTAFATTFALALPKLGPGRYAITWRGLGVDGHAMQGDLAFEVT